MFRSTILLVFLFYSSSQAFQFHPMEAEFASAGSDATKTFFVENKLTKPVAVELRIHARDINEDGTDKLSPNDDFFIYPQQLKLNPQQKRAVRITYRGEPKVVTEKAFRLIAEELPVNFSAGDKTEKATNISFLLKFVASIYVTPPDAQSRIEVTEVTTANNKTHVVLNNAGNKHKVLTPLEFISSDGQKYQPDEKEMKDIVGKNILAGKKIKLSLSSAKIKQLNGVKVQFLE